MRHIYDNGSALQGRAGERSPATFCCPHCKGEIALGGGLTQAQRSVLTFVVAFISVRQISPSIAEINEGLSLRSKSKTWEIVDQLCERGFLAKVGGPGRSRNLVITDAAGSAR